jgi:hypothetical protein
LPVNAVKQLMQTDLRGELTPEVDGEM